MSIVTTGALEIVDYGQATQHLEHWQSGGEIGYTITGGEYRDVTPLGEKWDHYRWTGRFRRQGRTMQITFLRGTGLPGVPPAEDILASAFSDAASVEWDEFEGWAGDMGYSTDDPDDQRRARQVYNACERMNDRLDRFFPTADGRRRWAEALEEVGR